jgi:GntR family transcriptional regulator
VRTTGVDPASDRPVYQQIADRLRSAIRSGELGARARLPSERELTEAYGVTRMTVRQALEVLKTEGLVTAEHGRGVFVRPHPPIQRKAFDRFARANRERGKAAYLAEMEEEGRRPEVQVLSVEPVPAAADVANRLGLREGDRVLMRRRRYLADGQPTEVATSYIPWEFAEGTKMAELDTGPGGIYARLEERGHELGRFTEEVTSRMPLPEEARALQLPSGVPVFRLVRTAYDTEGRPVEICDTVMVADRWVLLYELPAR